LTPNEIFAHIESDLCEVEVELQRQAESSVQLIHRIGQYLQASGGKRVRPALLLLSAKLCGFEGRESIKLAAVMELVHTATLVHDDIIDGAEMRRGRASVNAKWGNEITVLMGDWLFLTSFSLALGERNFKILDLLSDVTRKMIEGELMQLDLNGNLSITEDQHLAISERKTAYLFAACAKIGGLLGNLNGSCLSSLEAYGHNLGMAFQLTDDLLDFTADQKTFGKPVVHDLQEGKLTLPLIYLMELGYPEHREKIHAAIQENGHCNHAKLEVLRLVREFKTLDRARTKAGFYASAAKEALQQFPDSVSRRALASIAEYIVQREC
jgi:octaprenyl-diphosphate synthase